MRFTEIPVEGAWIIDPEPRQDERGSFARLWCAREFAEHRLCAAFVQCNSSVSPRRGTLRGLHYQTPPHEEIKLVRCARGAMFDVLVDLRRESATYLKWFGIELSAKNRRMVYVPERCAHGYLTLEDETEVEYPVSQFYFPGAERGIRWNDPTFAITWPDPGPVTVSVKDQAWPDYQS
jgi:dTDP-4-dehydrorhamnose 3,5-epimerase